MGNLTLDLRLEGIFPFHKITSDQYSLASRFTPRLNWEILPQLSIVASPTLQTGTTGPLTNSGTRFFRLQPDPRLVLSRYVKGNAELRTDIQEAYVRWEPNQTLQLRVGRDFWDTTVQSRFRNWSYAGFTDANIADAWISLGVGGEIRFHKPYTAQFPFDLKLFGSGAYGGRGETLGLFQGIATFLASNKYPDWVTVLGSSFGYAHYPQGSLSQLYPGVSSQAQGHGISPSVYLQQGIGKYIDLQVGYGSFISFDSLLNERRGLTVGADFHQNYWGLHANYGRIWRNDLEGITSTRVEDLLEVSGRWMVFGQKNRILNLTLGGILASGVPPIRFGIFTGLEVNVERLHLK